MARSNMTILPLAFAAISVDASEKASNSRNTFLSLMNRAKFTENLFSASVIKLKFGIVKVIYEVFAKQCDSSSRESVLTFHVFQRQQFETRL